MPSILQVAFARPARGLALLLWAAASAVPSVAAQAADAPVIAAAASLRIALDDIAKSFETAAGTPVRMSYGATGNLVRQIEQQAPFEVFLSADTANVDRLVAAGLTDGPGVLLMRGRVALVASKASGIAVDPGLEGLRAALKAGHINKFAIANPELAPYGKAALAVLDKAGLLDELSAKFVQGDNVAQAAQFVASGGAEAGLIAASLTSAPELQAAVVAAIVSEEFHPPLNQSMAILKPAGPVARAFFKFLQGPEAATIFVRSGFAVPAVATQ